MPVTYGEESGSPKYWFGPDGTLLAERVLRCEWADRDALIIQIGANGGEDFPHYPNYGCYAYGAAVEGRGRNTEASAGMNEYEHALITIRYSTNAPRMFGGRFLTEEFQPSGENTRLDPTDLRWDNAGGTALKTYEAPTYFHGMFDYILTFHGLLTIPAAAMIMNVSNSVAMTAFIVPLTFAVETLRHLRPAISHTVGLGLMDRFRLQYRWTYNPETWSKFRKADGTWAEVHHKTAGQLKPYTPYNMQQMYP